MHRALLKGPLCRPCRQVVTHSLSPISTISTARPSLSVPPIYNHARTFTSGFHLPSSNPPESHSIALDEKTQPETETSTSAEHIPWYLKEDTPATESQPVSSRDHLPELPENPPEILPEMLEYTFKDLGLDELKLFDLRSLETPPALGANVIMVIGTARSVKHLNVAADRLCRWLRSTYKLSPYADGLLGRNELKIKLRRKARRARLASQSGTMVDEKDDGITTGWICVNAGVVEEPSPAAQQEAKDQGFEGFGTISTGTRVVVQIFTEEKRAEVDLESLWQATLDRAARQKQREADSIANASPEVRGPKTTSRPISDRGSRNLSRSPVNTPLGQIRVLHNNSTPRTHRSQYADSMQDSVSIHDPTHSPDVTSHKNSTISLIEYLSNLPNEQAQLVLGTGSDDRDSTRFLRSFYDSPPEFPAESAALAELQLMCVAIAKQHQAYTKEDLWKTFIEYSMSGYRVPEGLGFHVISALLAKRPIGNQNVEISSSLLDIDKELALRGLEILSLRGTNVLNMKILTMLYTALSPEALETVPPDSKEGQALDRISQLIHILDVPFDAEQARILMILLFRNHDYDGFWKLWRRLPLDGSSRSAADYKRLFELHAELGDERRARDCLSNWVPMMAREDPPIALEGPLLRHIMYCLVIADPEIEHTASTESTSNLAQWWRACRGKMLAGDEL